MGWSVNLQEKKRESLSSIGHRTSQWAQGLGHELGDPGSGTKAEAGAKTGSATAHLPQGEPDHSIGSTRNPSDTAAAVSDAS